MDLRCVQERVCIPIMLQISIYTIWSCCLILPNVPQSNDYWQLDHRSENVKSGSQVPVEVPEVHVVELLTEVPKPQYEQIPKEIPMWLGTKIGLQENSRWFSARDFWSSLCSQLSTLWYWNVLRFGLYCLNGTTDHHRSMPWQVPNTGTRTDWIYASGSERRACCISDEGWWDGETVGWDSPHWPSLTRQVSVEQVENLQVVRQVAKPMVEYVEKTVPKVPSSDCHISSH